MSAFYHYLSVQSVQVIWLLLYIKITEEDINAKKIAYKQAIVELCLKLISLIFLKILLIKEKFLKIGV
ncbi:hypothetical protein A8F95_12005 [Bacillus wudalianchiensis]|uniref:Uncharacterized protein n=1 Tax=Pseudobacillus wudalianchiensis TaxID=1743143 RepID=A0A1B9AIR2_9BACI|nr:hypothetical protein A8F95_12005 [Bacillus wudalianchiensis]